MAHSWHSLAVCCILTTHLNLSTMDNTFQHYVQVHPLRKHFAANPGFVYFATARGTDHHYWTVTNSANEFASAPTIGGFKQGLTPRTDLTLHSACVLDATDTTIYESSVHGTLWVKAATVFSKQYRQTLIERHAKLSKRLADPGDWWIMETDYAD